MYFKLHITCIRKNKSYHRLLGPQTPPQFHELIQPQIEKVKVHVYIHVGLGMFADINFLLFSQFTPDHENINCKY